MSKGKIFKIYDSVTKAGNKTVMIPLQKNCIFINIIYLLGKQGPWTTCEYNAIKKKKCILCIELYTGKKEEGRNTHQRIYLPQGEYFFGCVITMPSNGTK